MSDQWTAVDRYITELFAVDRDAETALEASQAAGLPGINVTAPLGKLLYVLARAQSARVILEIGTLGGYSTIWLAKALRGSGRVVSLELNAAHAEVARDNLARAGLGHLVDIRVGSALEILPGLSGPFDVIFIDADKQSYPQYLEWALKLSRAGTLLIADNAIRGGGIIDAKTDDPRIQGMRSFLTRLAAEPRIQATVVQTVGAKGYDGFAIGLVINDPSSSPPPGPPPSGR